MDIAVNYRGIALAPRINNATHPAMEHILETEGFEKQPNEIGWMKNI